MRPILGGHVPPNRVVGRDRFIDEMWSRLENDSISLVSERRIGKTSVVFKMYKEPRPGWHPIFLVIEGVRSPLEFVSRIHDSLQPALTKKGRVFSTLTRIYQEVAGQQVGDWNLPILRNQWKRLLRAMLKDLSKLDDRLVFFWDELPLMISNILADHGPTTAMELMDVLRDHRVADGEGRLRMVYTGSVGLHLVVSELRRHGYRNDPTNDMYSLALGGLTAKYAQQLARQGLAGLAEQGELSLSDPVAAIAKAVAQETDGLPFYINHVVDRLTSLGRAVRVTDIPDVINGLIGDSHDPAHLEHYAERIEAYYRYDPQAGEIATAILNTLCRSTQPMNEEAIQNAVVTQMELKRHQLLTQTLAVLERDQYLTRESSAGKRLYQFKYDLIRRWWLQRRA